MNEDNIPEEILREWIVKAKPLVNSAYNLAVEHCMSIIESHTIYPVQDKEGFFVDKTLIITELNKLKQQ